MPANSRRWRRAAPTNATHRCPMCRPSRRRAFRRFGATSWAGLLRPRDAARDHRKAQPGIHRDHQRPRLSRPLHGQARARTVGDRPRGHQGVHGPGPRRVGAPGQNLRRAIAIACCPTCRSQTTSSSGGCGRDHMGDRSWTSISPAERRSSPGARRASDWPSPMRWPPKECNVHLAARTASGARQGRRGHPHASQGQGIVPSRRPD